MADLVFLCPQKRDHEAAHRLERSGLDAAFVGSDLDSVDASDVDVLVQACRRHRPAGVVGTKDRSALLAALVSERLGLTGPTPAAIVNCQHKLRSREIQRQVIPDATPRFAPVNGTDAIGFPCFVKPVVGRLSDSARRVESPDDLSQFVHSRPYARSYEAIAGAAGIVTPGECSGFLAEELLEGMEVTLEGFMHRAELTVLGITDSVNYQGTSSFERFEYPTALGDSRSAELAEVSRVLMPALGFDDGFFNIEFFVPETGSAKLVEVNGRLASQFAPLIEFAHGRSSYDVLASLARGHDPLWEREEPMGFALSYCVRVFHDALVERVPDPESDVEMLVDPGELLSRQGTNDAGSYRLCIFTQTGDDRAETIAVARKRAAKLRSGFQLGPAA